MKFWNSSVHVCNNVNVIQWLRETGLVPLREIHIRVVVRSKRTAKIHNGSADLRPPLWSLWFVHSTHPCWNPNSSVMVLEGGDSPR